MLRPFHVAVPVHDLAAARTFYGGLLGCAEGRSAAAWVDFNLYGHQFVCHRVPATAAVAATNPVDGEQVPVPHYGVVLGWDEWEALAARLQSAGVKFVVPPTVRFAGLPGEQATLFLCDPSGNALEFKALRDPAALFAR
ncbi:MAG: VOC family protein [Gammaproteobacteria bacterium]|jgi:extradiol dioxygenase family protein|nr:VOC family protein [Gammaproteobacteria bacterium]